MNIGAQSEVFWYAAINVASLGFFAGAAWYMLRDTRKKVEALAGDVKRTADLLEKRYRKILVVLATFGAQLVGTQPGAQAHRVAEVLQRMAVENED